MIKGFCDFNLSPHPLSIENVKILCEAALEAGYGTVAINTMVEESVFESRKKKKKGPGDSRVEGDLVPAPMQLESLKKEFEGKLEIFQRLTVQFSDNLQVHKLSQSKNVASYDILAVLPLTPAAYQIACSNMEVDVVTYDPTNTATLRISRKLVSQAIERGVHFELQYAPCVIDSSSRRNTITLAHTLHAVSREAMPVLITSAASHPEHMRSPYDIANLGLIFGLSEEKSKAAMTHSCRNVLLRALARRNSKAVVNVTVINQPSRDQSGNTEDDMDVENGNVPPAKRSKLPDKTHLNG